MSTVPVPEEVAILDVRHLSKRFAGPYVLNDVSITVRPGEIHGLIGENGSGKSTLIKILAGYHVPEAGSVIAVNGVRLQFPLKPGLFRELGMSFVHQDLGLIPSLTVTENLRVADLAASGSRIVSWSKERVRVRETLSRYDVHVDPAALVGDLRPTPRALIAIVRAAEAMRRTRSGQGLLILDEPTVFLPRAGVDQLFELVRSVKASGSGVLFVSHNLEEVRAITDRVTVLRDGQVVGCYETAGVREADLVSSIVGKPASAAARPTYRRVTAEHAAIQMGSLAGGLVESLDLTVHPGEVIGLTGIAGSGFEDVPYLAFGVRRAQSGWLRIDGAFISAQEMTPVTALRMRVVLVPADRQRDGSAPSLTLGDNVMLPRMPSYRRRGFLDRRRLRRDARGVLKKLDVRPPEPGKTFRELSGGNQQKALLAKWLETSPRLLLLHEPVQGVDVGARLQIFDLIRSAALEGRAILCSSSDHELLEAVSDRVMIFSKGRVVKELHGVEITRHRITELSYNTG
jgi:ribose transport system ATP-binding protein